MQHNFGQMLFDFRSVTLTFKMLFEYSESIHGSNLCFCVLNILYLDRYTAVIFYQFDLRSWYRQRS